MLGRKFYFEKKQNKKKQHYVVCAVQWPARRSKRPNSTNPEMMQKTKKHTTHIKQMHRKILQQRNAAVTEMMQKQKQTNPGDKCESKMLKIWKTQTSQNNCKREKLQAH